MTERGGGADYDEAYGFEVVVHPRPSAAVVSGEHLDAWGQWPVLQVPRESLVEPFPIGFEAVLTGLDRLPRMFVEPDGAVVWRSSQPDRFWQVDGTLLERQDRLLAAELNGRCPAGEFDRLLAAFGWPEVAVMFQVVRAGVILDEPTFRRHAIARGALRSG
jgi:hypothetical protein